MKKILISISLILSFVGFSNNCNYKLEMIDKHLKDVLKTQNQLIPKLCRYIVITGVKKEEFNMAKNSIKLALLANSTVNDELFVFIDKRQESFEDIKKIVENFKTGLHNIYEYDNEQNLIENILNNKTSDKLDYRRILLLTSSKNMRVYYAKMIDSLEDNKQNMLIDNFAYLYNMTRHEYENPSKEEIEKVYQQINCNK